MTTDIMPDFTQVVKVQPSSPKEMLSVKQDGARTIVRVNSSSLSIIQTCARKARYTLYEGWRGKQGSPPLVHGSAIHKALEVFYTQPREAREFPRDFDNVAPGLAHGHMPPEQHFLYDALMAYVRAAEPLRILPDTDKRSLASGIWTLAHYFKTYLNDAYVIHRDADGPMVERFFEVPFYEDATLTVILFGTIDFVLKNLATGELLIGDHKTASQLSSDFLNRIKPNHQYTGYLYGAQKAFGVSGHFLVNGIQVKARPVTSRGGPPIFTRQITVRSEHDFDEFTEVVVEAVRNYLRWLATGTWPLGNVDSCAQWGGCQFLDICSSPNALRQNILEAKYTRGEA